MATGGDLLSVLGGRALREISERWIASADTPDGPSLGLRIRVIEAIEAALALVEWKR